MWEKESEKYIMIVGHRGVRSLYPENTLVSFRAALDLKLDLIEFDVRKTKDGHLVVCHDADIERTTDSKGLIREMTLEQLKAVDAGIKAGEQFAGERIPTLEETLDLMVSADYGVLLNVEIKDYDHQVVDETIGMLKKYGIAERCVIACFNAAVVGYVQDKYPEMRTQGFPERYMLPNTDPDYPITEQLYEKMFGIGIPIRGSKTDDASRLEDVAMAKKYNIRPWLFCADDEESTILAVEAGATNITCNHPYATLKYLAEQGLR